jgi:outer membrane immunogenic protein
MKFIQLSGASLVVLMAAAAPTFAADMPVKGPVTKAAAVAPIFNWSGLYGGLHVGGVWGSVRDLSFGGGDPDPHGWNAGALAGWNQQSGIWVWGIEVDAGGGRTTGSNVSPDGFLQENDVRFVGNLRARVGPAVGRTLFFLAAGASVANLRLVHEPGDSTVSKFLPGWTVGGGVDYAATDNFVLRLEYLYADYRKKDFGFYGGTDPHRVALNTHIVRGAAIWRFATGKAPAPVVTRY